MEVMSSLLLCALLALLPQALVLGKQTERLSSIKFNNSLLIGQKPNHKLLLNLNAPPLVTRERTKNLQSVFGDEKCVLCFDCMERAIKAHRYSKLRSDSEELHSELLTNTITIYRNKRSATSTPSTEPKKDRRGRKKNRAHKTIVVTKYNMDGEVYALKVKESSPDHNEEGSNSCLLYSVQKSMPCNSSEGDALIKNVQQKGNKKEKRQNDRYEVLENKKIPGSTRAPLRSLFRKRQVDDSQMPENVMSSVEEFY